MQENKLATLEAEKSIAEAKESMSSHLSLAKLRISQLPKSINSLTNHLLELDLDQCRQLTCLTPLSILTNLQQLNISGCDQVTDLAPLAKLQNLQRLIISAWSNKTDR